MARIRSIKPAFFTDDVIAELTHRQRLVFIGLWTIADREGRLEDKPLVIRAMLLPYEAADMNVELDAIAAKKLIRRYVVAGKRYIEVVNFVRHQVVSPREVKATIPPPCAPDTAVVGNNDAEALQLQCSSTASALVEGEWSREGDPDPSLRSGSVSVLPLTLALEDSGSGSDTRASETNATKVHEVFAHYREHHPRAFPAPKSTSQEWRKITARFGEGYSVADLCQAIDGYHASPFHCGENDSGARYLDLELIVRDGTHVAKGIELQARPPPPVMTRVETKGKRAGQSWIDRKRGSGNG